ncbi:MAG: hypothetical protein ACREPM_17310 [Gemmatimonadaceae bacterium]
MNSLSFVRASSPFNASRALIARLFDGIELDPNQEARALELVSESIDAGLAVTLRNADGWSRLIALNSSRDAALRMLLASDGDRALFDAHSAELKRQMAANKPSSDNAPVVLRVGSSPMSGGTLEIVYRADGMADEAMEASSWHIVRAFRNDAEQMGLSRISTIADILERRDKFASYSRSVTRTFGRQTDGSWVALPAG